MESFGVRVVKAYKFFWKNEEKRRSRFESGLASGSGLVSSLPFPVWIGLDPVSFGVLGFRSGRCGGLEAPPLSFVLLVAESAECVAAVRCRAQVDWLDPRGSPWTLALIAGLERASNKMGSKNK